MLMVWLKNVTFQWRHEENAILQWWKHDSTMVKHDDVLHNYHPNIVLQWSPCHCVFEIVVPGVFDIIFFWGKIARRNYYISVEMALNWVNK